MLSRTGVIYQTINKKIEYLFCYSNQFTAIDFSANLKLRVLDCHSNNISSLDFSKNLALEELDCAGNILKNLYLSGNLALKELDSAENPDLREICLDKSHLEIIKNDSENWEKDEFVKWVIDCKN